MCKENPDCDAIVTAYRAATARCKYHIKQLKMRKEQRVIDTKNAGIYFWYVNKRLTCRRGIGHCVISTMLPLQVTVNVLTYWMSIFVPHFGITPPFERVVSNDLYIDDIELIKVKLKAIRKLKPSRSGGPYSLTPLLNLVDLVDQVASHHSYSPRFYHHLLSHLLCYSNRSYLLGNYQEPGLMQNCKCHTNPLRR